MPCRPLKSPAATAGFQTSLELRPALRAAASQGLRQAKARPEEAQTHLDLAGQQVRRQVRQAWRQVATAQHPIQAAAQARHHAAERLR
ncbi:MAG: hypothetical protein FJY95_21465 [Candidatus Handelsmanbacteria bacterium]|nr:hypothetical protein [Candidatus Handelsmanbacteria bacterium]